MSELVDAAYLLIADARAMMAHFATEDPERVLRPGWQRMGEHADALEAALDASDLPLTDPGANTPGPVRGGALATERAAALAVMPNTGTVRLEVLERIAAAGDDGRTHPELEEVLKGRAAPSSVRTRCSELVTGGWVRETAETRPTAAGLDATVWKLTEKGRAELGLEPSPPASLFN
ncbi:MAG TPA: hypothetical protein VMW08_00440 [Acidimicrobiales bacterium]|nr:hypothetical protein [Acidimicrobiales bacterium]